MNFETHSQNLYDYYSQAYGRIALGVFMEAIEKCPDLTLREIYERMDDTEYDEGLYDDE